MTRPKSTVGSTGAMPKGAPSRCAWAILAAAISALDGTQPWLRQSPPIAARSISTTRRPSWAAPEATTRPAEPPPTTQTSGLRTAFISRRGLAAQMRVDHRYQRQRGQPEQGQQEAPFEDDAEVRHLAAVEQQAEARADAGIDERRRDDADQRRQRVGAKPHAEQRRHDIDQPEREYRHQPQEQQVAEAVAAKTILETRQCRAGAVVEEIVEGGAGGQEHRDRAQRGADHRQDGAHPDAEQEAAERRDDDGDRQREGH